MRLATLALLCATALLPGCQTSKGPSTKTLTCPPALRAEAPPEPKAPQDALVNDAAKFWLAAELFPWMRDNARVRTEAHEWCKRPE